MPDRERVVDTPLAAARRAWAEAERNQADGTEDSPSPLEAAVAAALAHPATQPTSTGGGSEVEALEERLGNAEAELDKWEPVLVPADRLREAYEVAIECRDLGGLPPWEKGDILQPDGRHSVALSGTTKEPEGNAIQLPHGAALRFLRHEDTFEDRTHLKKQLVAISPQPNQGPEGQPEGEQR